MSFDKLFSKCKNQRRRTESTRTWFRYCAQNALLKKGKTMKNKAVKIGIVASILPHLFCCVLPIVLSLIGLFAPEVAHTSFIPESVEPWIFVFSALMLLLSWVLVWRDCPCAECESEKSHKTQKIILSVITVVFILSILLHIFAHS